MIRDRVAALFGQGDGNSGFYRCPGDNACDLWDSESGSYEEKKNICLDCRKCNGKFPLLNQSNSPEAIQLRIIAHVERIISKENAGQIDMNELDYFDWRLVEIYRDEERNQERIFKARTNAIFEVLVAQSNR